MRQKKRISSSRLSPLRRVASASKREIEINPNKRSRPSSRDSTDLNAILTSLASRSSSRPNSGKDYRTKAATVAPPISDLEFYLNSAKQTFKHKSQFERNYEEKVQKFLLTDGVSEFSPLDLEVSAVSLFPPSLACERAIKDDSQDQEENRAEPEVEVPTGATFDEDTTITPELIAKETQNPLFVCGYLLKSADLFLDQAHRIVLSANYLEGTKAYFRLVKAALKALHIVIAQYQPHLRPEQAASVFYRIAKIYLDETENYSSAERYAKKSMTIASKHNLVLFMVAAELLCAKVLEVSDPPLLKAFLKERQILHEQEGRLSVSSLFVLKRIESANPTEFASILQALEKTNCSSVDPMLHSLSLLLQAKLHIAQGSLKVADLKLHECRGVFLRIGEIPPQLKAMLYLQYLSLCTQKNDYKHGRKWIQKLTDLVKKQRENKWHSWCDDGAVPISLSTDTIESVSFLLQWIGPDELIPTIYLSCGVYYINESTELGKAKKILDTCVGDVEKGLKALTSTQQDSRKFGISHLTNKIVRLSCLKFLAVYYQAWLGLMSSSDFSGMKFITAFISSYNLESFTAEELWYYNFLLPPFHYLLAMMHQAQGDLKAAKGHFMKARNLTVRGSPVPVDLMHLQNALGLGYKTSDSLSELYIYSTLHLLIISEYEFRSLTQVPNSSPQHEQTLRKSRSTLAYLHTEMTKIMESTTLHDTITANELFILTYKSALAVFYSDGFEESDKRPDASLVSEIEKLVFSDSVKVQNVELLALYILLRLAVNLDKSNRAYGKCTRRLSKAEDNGKILSLFVYLEAQKRELAANDAVKAEKIKRKIDGIAESVRSKIDAARKSFLANLSGPELLISESKGKDASKVSVNAQKPVS